MIHPPNPLSQGAFTVNAPFGLTGRLGALAGLVASAPCQRLVDVGCDHATVPVQLLKEGICTSVLVTDLRKGPLEAARRRADQAGVREGFDALQKDGLKGVELLPTDTLLISGLGGDTISAILESDPEKTRRPERIIIQSQTKEELVRRALMDCGRPISQELCLEDKGQVYLIILSDRSGTCLEADALQLFFGPQILRSLEKGRAYPALDRYLSKRIRRLRKQAVYQTDARKMLEAFEESYGIPYNKQDQD